MPLKDKTKNPSPRVMAEYGSSGIWAIGQRSIWRHEVVEHSTLKLPPDLSQRFEP